MSRPARAELADAIRSRYSAAAGKDKRKILHEFIAATGYHEKSAIRILNGKLCEATRQQTIVEIPNQQVAPTPHT